MLSMHSLMCSYLQHFNVLNVFSYDKFKFNVEHLRNIEDYTTFLFHLEPEMMKKYAENNFVLY